MAKSWTNLTRREKVIGVLVSVFAVFAISGVASAINNSPTVQPNTKQTPSQESKVDASPSITYKETEETQTIAFDKTSKDDGALTKGATSITTAGVDGVKTITYKLTLTDGVETNKEIVNETVTKTPVAEVTSIGTYVAPVAKKVTSKCDPNYSGCVPIASDVDCGGGSGNGPEYLYGTASVIGSDIYGLDRDGDGIACE